MAFETLTLDDLHAFALSLGGVLLPGYDWSRGSWPFLFTRLIAGVATDDHAHIDAVKNDIMPDTAATDMLTRWMAIFGVPRKGATGARKSSALRVYGTVTSPVPANSPLEHVSGLNYETGAASVVGPGGYVDVDVQAIDTGSQTRLDAGEQLTFVNTPSGLQPVAVLQIDMDEDGTDAETDGAAQARLLNRIAQPAMGGNANDYEQWAEGVTGIAQSYTYPLRAGRGTVDVAALHAGSGSDRVLLAPETASLQATLNTLRPITAVLRVLQTYATTVDVEVLASVDGDPTHAFDWDDGTGPLVLAWTAGTRTLQLAAARPPSMLAGQRLSIVPAAGGGTGMEYVIEALVSTDSVILQAAPALAPVAGDHVYSGGSVVQPARAAIQAYFDGLGTANPDDHRYGTWDGNVRPNRIIAAAESVPGLLIATLVTPTDTIQATDPTYPNDGTIELLIAGRITVRAA